MPEEGDTGRRSRTRRSCWPNGRIAEYPGAQVKEWVERAGWRTRTIEKPINDRKPGGTRSLSCSWRRTRSRWP